jgi:hypothetical protein
MNVRYILKQSPHILLLNIAKSHSPPDGRGASACMLRSKSSSSSVAPKGKGDKSLERYKTGKECAVLAHGMIDECKYIPSDSTTARCIFCAFCAAASRDLFLGSWVPRYKL